MENTLITKSFAEILGEYEALEREADALDAGPEHRGVVDPDPVATMAKNIFNVNYLFPYQRLVIANVLDCQASENAEPVRQIVILPTGFGKSLCFQIPALMLAGPTIIAYPLLSLMEDQRRRLEECGIVCALFRGGMSAEEKTAAQDLVRSGAAKIIITNPETLAVDSFLEFLASVKVTHLALDEAHCVSEWGETFRPSYLELGRVIARLNPPAVSAFTATASPTVFESVARTLFAGVDYRLIEGDPDRPNLTYTVVPTLCKLHSLVRLLQELPRPTIVFCSSRTTAQILVQTIARRLNSNEIRFYHAGLERAEKKNIEEWFFKSDTGVLLATCAYGMGVDKKNIRSVIHYEAPASVEAYLQEAGRGGRDGGLSRAVLLFAPSDHDSYTREENTQRAARWKLLIDYAMPLEKQVTQDKILCRREALITMLGGKLNAFCSGCDRCDGTNIEEYEGGAELKYIIQKNKRRFTKSEFIEFAGAHRVTELASGAGYALLHHWEEEDVEEAVEAALVLGYLKLNAGGFWKAYMTTQGDRISKIDFAPLINLLYIFVHRVTHFVVGVWAGMRGTQITQINKNADYTDL